MCRLLGIQSDQKKDYRELTRDFADMCQNNSKWQGDGWGILYFTDGEWKEYKSITPIWEEREVIDELPEFQRGLVFARLAFRKETIAIKHTQPYISEKLVFAFNGNLRGVKIKSAGKIGAEKIYSQLLERYPEFDLQTALDKIVEKLINNSRDPKAINIIAMDDTSMVGSCNYWENSQYHTMQFTKNSHEQIICSEPLPGYSWEHFSNHQSIQFVY